MKELDNLELKVGDNLIIRNVIREKDLEMTLKEQYYAKGIKMEMGYFIGRKMGLRIPLQHLERVDKGIYKWEWKDEK